MKAFILLMSADKTSKTSEVRSKKTINCSTKGDFLVCFLDCIQRSEDGNFKQTCRKENSFISVPNHRFYTGRSLDQTSPVAGRQLRERLLPAAIVNK